MAGIQHYIFYSTVTGGASYCASGKKAEKAIADIAKAGLSYVSRLADKAECPFCNPKAPSADETEQEPKTAADIPEEAIRPGQCHECRRGDPFKLSFENHVMIRTCRHCGDRLNLVTLEALGK